MKDWLFKKVLPVVLVMALLLVGADRISRWIDPWQERLFVGKSAQSILETYGSFDYGDRAKTDYANCTVGYTIRQASPGFLQQRPELLFYIHFDENGIADRCYEGERKGG